MGRRRRSVDILDVVKGYNVVEYNRTEAQNLGINALVLCTTLRTLGRWYLFQARAHVIIIAGLVFIGVAVVIQSLECRGFPLFLIVPATPYSCYETPAAAASGDPPSTILKLSLKMVGAISPKSQRFTKWLIMLGTRPLSFSSSLLLRANSRQARGICLSAINLGGREYRMLYLQHTRPSEHQLLSQDFLREGIKLGQNHQ